MKNSKRWLSFMLVWSLVIGSCMIPYQHSAAKEKVTIYYLNSVKSVHWTSTKMTFYGKLKSKLVTYNQKKTFKLDQSFKCMVADPSEGWYRVSKKEFKEQMFKNGVDGKLWFGAGFTIKVKNQKIIEIAYEP